MKKNLLAAILAVFVLTAINAQKKDNHLIILSGQSNMGRLDPSISFKPIVREALAPEDVVFVKGAWGGRSIDKWYPNGGLYTNLMKLVTKEVNGQSYDSFKTVSFIWMQGEADSATPETANNYGKNLEGLEKQLSDEIGRDDIHVVIGRLNDARDNDPKPERAESWKTIKKQQVEFAESYKSGAWINTDDLNGSKNSVHNDEDPKDPNGYKYMGIRFAKEVVKLINGKILDIDEESFVAHEPDGIDTYMERARKNKEKKKNKKKKKKEQSQ